MRSSMFMFLIGAVHIYHQVLAADAQDVYIAELMVESNVTLEAQTILTALNTTTDLQVTDAHATVTFSFIELVAECLIVGSESTCNCYTGYIWSNEICYNYNCCRETTCRQNVSHITPLCIAKIKVHISGSVTMNTGTWDSTRTTELETNFGGLNGFEYLNVTGQRKENKVADFEAAVSIRLVTSKLQAIVTQLETSLDAELSVKTVGMVTIESPETTVCYESTPVLTCKFEEATGSADWYMSTKERFQLNDGSVVKLNLNCATDEYKSCVNVTLNKVTGIWSGLYECGFTNGSVRHTAKTHLSVALLPDVINMEIDPLTADCSGKQSTDNVLIKVTTTISNSTASFEVWWSYMNEGKNDLYNTSDGENLVYIFDASISCKKTDASQRVNVTFQNSKEQIKSAYIDIPVIYAGAKFCPEDNDGGLWPKTPARDTVINRTCAEGRVGYKSRTCEGSTWKSVYFYCVNEELNKVVNTADNFLKGLGATQEVAMHIFEGLKNSSTDDSAPVESIADILASVNVLDVMANASESVTLQEDVFPDLVEAASNMLNKTWAGVNNSIVQEMSSNYLRSVENLVKNIKVNRSNELNSQNLELKFCSHSACNVSVFDIGVTLNKSAGMIKTVAVKNLMDKLKNNFKNTVSNKLLISATVENSSGLPSGIRLDFPQEHLNGTKPLCVFWDTAKRQWSEEGCNFKTGDGNRTVCECNHLTSFSVLMSKGDISTDVLDIITRVGLSVSICSLVIFLIIESLVWSAVVKTNLSHFRHTAIVNIAMFLLLADCSFLASSDPESLSPTWCLVLTICKHLFFLAMFSWMLCMSVMLVHQLIFVFSPLRKRVFMFLSSIAGYVCPILIVGSSYVYCKYTNKPYHNSTTCWLVYDKLLDGSIHAFLLPVGTVILTNLFSMVVVILTLVKSSVPEGSKADDKETAKSIIKVVVFLTPVFGGTWIIGFALLLLDNSDPMFQVASYSFTILNSFQGLFILITGCFAEQKVREEMFKLIMAKSRGKSESMKNLTSTTNTKDK